MRTMAAPKTALAPVANEAELAAAVTPDAISVASAAAVSAASFVLSAAVFPPDVTTVHLLP